MCRALGLLGCAACARIAGFAQPVFGLLGSCSVCQDCWGHSSCAKVDRVMQYVPGSLGSLIMCQVRWGHARVARVVQCVLEREVCMKFATEGHQSRDLKNLGLSVKLVIRESWIL